MLDSNGCIELLPLPAELLMYIFKLATDSPMRNIDRFVELPPFEAIDSRVQEEKCNVALKTKWSLSLTCSAFRRLCAGILYEDIRVGYSAPSLADALERSEAQSPGAGLGRVVKRAVLFPVELEEDSGTSERVSRHTRRILACCPNIRVISRPKSTVTRVEEVEVTSTSTSSSDDLQFNSLQRVDWSSCPSDDPPVLSELPPSIWSSEALISLSVGVKEWSRFTAMRETETVNIFSTIRTLRVRSLNAFGVPGQRLFLLELPVLQRLVLDQPDSMYSLFSVVQYGAQIETLELGLHSGFLEHDYIMVLLVYCPNTTDLYFPIFTTCVTRENLPGVTVTYSVKRVVLHAAVEDETGVDDTWKWRHLSSQFEALCGQNTRFTKLEQVIMYGSEWRTLVGDPRLKPSLHLLHSKGVSLVCEDREANLLLKRNTVMYRWG